MAAISSKNRTHFDVLIIGGGINGAGIARDAALKGYSVCLCDAGDFGGGTSSASTKLIHGGLRYLEHYEFGLVRKALMEREILWSMAPHIIWPMRFVLPHHNGLRPAWLLRLGLFLYDYLGGRKLLPPTKTLNLSRDQAGKSLKKTFKKAFEYSDCWVEDSRLVILNLRSAQAHGADIRPRTKASRAVLNKEGDWSVELGSSHDNDTTEITASVVVNAAGPWIDEVLGSVFGVNDVSNVRLVRGSHVVIRKKFDHDRAYIFQNSDERVIFAIPYEGDFTLIGTTDKEHESLAEPPKITGEETRYLCEMASEYFDEPVTPADIVWTYSGIRPLYDDGASRAQEATRDYVIKPEPSVGNGNLINVFGGKITTFRTLSAHVTREIEDRLKKTAKPVNSDQALPGGDFPVTGFDDLVVKLCDEYSYLEPKIVERLARLYGTEARTILGGSNNLKDLGTDFGCGLYEAEVRFLMLNEWAHTGEDVLYRRTKLGIRISEHQKKKLSDWMSANP